MMTKLGIGGGRNPEMGRHWREWAFADGLGMAIALYAQGAVGQAVSFGADARHSGNYPFPAQPLNAVHWGTNTDLYGPSTSAHYGAPLITPANTLVLPVRTNATNFMLNVFAGDTGAPKYTLPTDYTPPPFGWLPVLQPVLAAQGAVTRLYYPGAGGTVLYVENPDAAPAGPPVRECFYTSLAAYQSNATGLQQNVYVCGGLTADTNGTVFFGYRALTNGPNSATAQQQGGFARLDWQGRAVAVAATAVLGPAAGSTTALPPQNAAPALSPDGAVVYVAVKSLVPNTTNYLVGLDSTTLATRYQAPLRSPQTGQPLVINSDSTASPLVGPDGDVYFGVWDGNSRGFLLHFSADLKTVKIPSGFGWDITPSIVPTNLVPWYTGPSAYLLVSKYNYYAGFGDGDGVNRLALLDPNAAQSDPHPLEAGLRDMRIVRSMIGCTPDMEYWGTTYPAAVREWCVNTLAVNPASGSVFAASEDGNLYRWNLALNSLTEVVSLGPAASDPYVPNAIGPDGTVHALNSGRALAVGGLTNVSVTLTSSAPDNRYLVAGQTVVYTATVSNVVAGGPPPGGAVTFVDVTYNGLSKETRTLAAAVPLTNGVAVAGITADKAGTNYLGNHFITAQYGGDPNYPAGSATLVQKVHAWATATALTRQPWGTTGMVLTAVVSVPAPAPTGAKPTGMVSFWDGGQYLDQRPLSVNQLLTVQITNALPAGGDHFFQAVYESDTFFAGSTGALAPPAPLLQATENGGTPGLQLLFSNLYGGSWTVLGTTNLFTPLSNWSVLGTANESVPGWFQFIDPAATNPGPRFYRVRNP